MERRGGNGLQPIERLSILWGIGAMVKKNLQLDVRYDTKRIEWGNLFYPSLRLAVSLVPFFCCSTKKS